MRLHIDGIIFSLQPHGGITVYFRELLKRLEPHHQAVLTLESPVAQSLAASDFPSVHVEARTMRRLERVRAARSSINGATAVFHSSYYRRPARSSQPTVVTVHDFVHERQQSGIRAQSRRWLINNAIRQAQHIICISEATRDDLLELVPIRADQVVSVIYNGVSELFRPVPSVGNSLSIRPFILFVGQRGGYKNFALALQAMAHLPELEMHCVGGGALRMDELEAVPESVRNRIKHLGFVDDEKLNALYNEAVCLLYPSAYEGFGIPVLEAMRAGCPVVSIACKAVLEVGQNALCVADDPRDPVAVAKAVLRASDRQNSEKLRALGLAHSQKFSWDLCFSQTESVYQSLAT